MCAVFAGLAGLMITSNATAADPNSTGLFLEIDAILAVVIGGTSLAGGRFSLAGTLIGAFIIQTMTTMILTSGIRAGDHARVQGGDRRLRSADPSVKPAMVTRLISRRTREHLPAGPTRRRSPTRRPPVSGRPRSPSPSPTTPSSSRRRPRNGNRDVRPRAFLSPQPGLVAVSAHSKHRYWSRYLPVTATGIRRCSSRSASAGALRQLPHRTSAGERRSSPTHTSSCSRSA